MIYFRDGPIVPMHSSAVTAEPALLSAVVLDALAPVIPN